MVKERITLSIDKEVVQETRSRGFNVSAFTERMLKGYTSVMKPDGNLHDGYRQLFDSILPLLKGFNCNVKVAKSEDTVPSTDGTGKDCETEMPVTIFLEPDGLFYVDELDSYFKDIKRIPQRHFLRPEKILSNLFEALARSEEAEKGKMKEILMAKNIVDAVSKTLLEKPRKRIADKGGRIGK